MRFRKRAKSFRNKNVICIVMMLLVLLVLPAESPNWISTMVVCLSVAAVVLNFITDREYIELDKKGIICTKGKAVLWKFTWDEIAALKKSSRMRRTCVEIVPKDGTLERLDGLSPTELYFEPSAKAVNAIHQYYRELSIFVRGRRFVLPAVIVALIFASCSALKADPYICDVDTVESIQIAKLLGFDETNHYRFEVEVLGEVADVQAFAERLNAIKQSTNWGEPMTMDYGDTIVVVNYPNGDADLLCSDAQVFVRGTANHTGYIVFDHEQFETLVEEYVTQ